jgi:hypothetical protein
MSSSLYRYLSRLEDTIRSRREIEIEELQIHDRSQITGRTSLFRARLRLPDGSLLQIHEALVPGEWRINKTRYAYQYQDADGQLVFRYDNAAHHPEVATHPDHKHTPAGIEPTSPPDLIDVLREIDEQLYGM